MSLRLKDKVAVVTGASKGIGAGIAKAFANEGAKVVVNYASSKADADKVVATITANGGTAIAVQGDVSALADVKKLFAATKTAYGQLDILVNNAGVYQNLPLEEITEENFHTQFNINVLGTILSIKEATNYFGESGGNIINVSSVVSQKPFPNMIVYAATKGAVDNITKNAANDLAPKKIRVNTIAPGAVETEGTHAAGLADGMFEQIASITPLGRVGQPEDIAKVAVFLASDEAAWVTGERISASGGLS